MSRTLAPPPDDRGMWRRALARLHPDAGGSDDLFVWASAVRDSVCAGIGPGPTREEERPRRRGPYTSGPADEPDRVPFEDAFSKAGSFEELTRQAVERAGSAAAKLAHPYAEILLLLADCHEVEESAGALYRQQYQGATYKQLAAVAYRAGMSKAERVRWYRIAESIPLSQRHAGHILGRLQKEAA